METPLEARRRELAQQELSLKAAEEKHRQFIERAPKIAEKIQREQRERFIRDASHIETRGPRGEFQLPDNRYLEADGTLMPTGTVRRTRQQGKWLFFVLILGLVVAAVWAWLTLTGGAY
jgi:hypothetical protein